MARNRRDPDTDQDRHIRYPSAGLGMRDRAAVNLSTRFRPMRGITYRRKLDRQIPAERAPFYQFGS